MDYNEINNGLLKTAPSDDYVMEGADAPMDRKIRELFTAPHIGMHGCVGYCISLLNMMGLDSYASKLAEVYEKHIDLKSVDIFCVAGLRALVLQKMRDGEFEKSIQYSLAVIECLLYMDKLFKEARREKTGSDDMDEEQHQEILMNLATSLSNLALVYFYMEDLNKARVHFEKAKEYAVKANDVRDLSVITFNLARVNYENDYDYDKFLESLKVSAEYAKNAGKLDTLAEILLEECKVRLEIGEYYLSHEILEEIACHLKNIGNFDLHIIAKQLRAKYFLRIGEGKKSLDCFKETVSLVKEKGNVYCAKILFVNAVKMYDQDSGFWSFMDVLCGMCGIDSHDLVNNLPSHSGHIEAGQISLTEFIIETLPADQWRKSIIICEYKKEKVYLPALFSKLCTEYTKRKNWFRLRDEAKCYYNAAETEDDQSVALYYLGCADMESKNYTGAVEYFEAVIRMGSKANQHYWVWANMELAKIKIQSRDINASIRYYEAGKNALQLDSNVNEVVNACMSYVQHLFNEGCLEEAIACANHLLKDIKDTDLKKSIEETIDIFEAVRRKKGKETDLDVKADPPEKIADEAIRLYGTGEDIVYAWELIRIAKEKYEKNGNMAGIGRCENNMADFNRKEGKTEEAAAHYEKAMYIKEKLGDIKGVINQLSNIISLYIEAPDSINIERFINYALLHMPEYNYYIEKYKLFFALFVYYILNEQYAEALHFAKLAHKGLDYFPEADMDPEVKKMLIDFIHDMEGAFREPEKSEAENDRFRNQVLEATRMYKAGNFSACIALLDGLCREVQTDYFNLGVVKGTYGNACLYAGRYQEAIKQFDEAISLFSDVKETEKSKAEEHIRTAVNGITQALDHLGYTEEAIGILRRELSVDGLPDRSRFAYTISLCNRLIRNNQDNMIKGDLLFLEILEMLNVWTDYRQLPHEGKGVLYSAFGLLYRVVSDTAEAEKYYELARKEFLITNSLHLKKIQLSLKAINDEKI